MMELLVLALALVPGLLLSFTRDVGPVAGLPLMLLALLLTGQLAALGALMLVALAGMAFWALVRALEIELK